MATVGLLRIPLAGAKRIAHNSNTWSDVHDRDDQRRDRLVKELG